MLFSIVLIITNTSCILVKSLVETDFPYNEKGGKFRGGGGGGG